MPGLEIGGCAWSVKPRAFGPGTLELLQSYSYPGNIRELRYAIEHAGILSEDGVLRPEDFPFAGARADASGASAAAARRVRTRPIAQEITPERLQQVLREQGGNRVRTARALQISRATLYRLLDRVEGETPVETTAGSDRVTGFRGLAGSGKSTALVELAAALVGARRIHRDQRPESRRRNRGEGRRGLRRPQHRADPDPRRAAGEIEIGGGAGSKCGIISL